MSHQDKRSTGKDVVNYRALKEAVNGILTQQVFSQIRFRGGSLWQPITLAIAAVLWAWSDESTLVDRFGAARKTVSCMSPGQPTPPGSYQAFMKILRKWSDPLIQEITNVLRNRMREDLSKVFLIAGFAVFGVDGSRFELARTVANEQAYSPKPKSRCRRSKRDRKRRRRNQVTTKKVNSPQIWVTTMWHAGTGLPWDWRSGPSDSSERAHLLEMLSALPENSLITADAGFVGYDYWREMLLSDRHFVVRVGSNVRLLKKLGAYRESKGAVYLWPDRAAMKEQPPLILRLVVAQDGAKPVYLVTSVLSKRRLSNRQVIEVYRLRWGVELWYRGCKQTFERRKMRSHRADHAKIELDWSLLGLWTACFLGLCEQAQDNIPPKRLSVAGVLRAVRKPMRQYRSKPEPNEDLHTLLRHAITDNYQRNCKSSRDYPRKNHNKTSPPGKPTVKNATKRQRAQAKLTQPVRLTA